MDITPEQAAIRQAADALLELLDATVPHTTIHYAVEDARRALRTLSRVTDGIKTQTVDLADEAEGGDTTLAQANAYLRMVGIDPERL